MAATRLETRTVPITVSFLVEGVLRASRVSSLTTQHWFMPEARAAVKQNVLVIRSEDTTHGRII